jgi:beta-galactosidase
VKVYSNCDEVELFVNEVSYGIRRRNIEDFPAAGLRWQVHMREGTYHFRAVARKGKTTVEDDLTQYYQTTRWSQPVKIFIEKVSEEKDVVVVEASLRDGNNTLCLDAGNWIMFSLAGDGKLIDNMGTSTASRKVQAYNGRATIQIKLNGGSNVVAAKSPGLPTALFHLNQKRDNP